MCTVRLVLLVFATLNLVVYNSKKIHNCVHNQLKFGPTPKTLVKYSYDINKPNRRRLYIPIEEYNPIRIKPYWGAIDANFELSATKKNLIKALVSAAINYVESFVSVIPVDGPLYVARECSWGYEVNGPLHNYFNCAGDGVLQQCGLVNIPSSHLRNEWIYDGFGNINSHSYPSGNGLSETDLIIYVSAQSHECGAHTLAWARHCDVDQYGRPISGTINFCPLSLDEVDWKMDVSSTLHELTHILVFTSDLFPTFIDTFGNPLSSDNIMQQVVKQDLGLNNTYLITPNVQSFVRKHYGCDTLIGAPLEDDGGSGMAGSHWEEHHFNGEYMMGRLYDKLDFVSGLTLALFEDSGWYKIDYHYSEPYSWGKNEGCDFFNKPCFDATTESSNFPQYFCGPTADRDSGLCTYDYSAKSQCYNYWNASDVPSQFKYFTDNNLNAWGPETSEHCPFADSYADYIVTDFTHVCWDTRGNSIDNYYTSYGELYSMNSRCLYGTVNNQQIEQSFCYPIECNLTDENIIIYINSAQIICNKADKLKYKSLLDDGNGNEYNISCPNYDSICISDKPFECVWGFWNNNLNKCVCSAGYTGNICDQTLMNVQNDQVTLYTNSYNEISGHKDTICLKFGTLDLSVNGNWQYIGVYDDIYPYYKKDLYYLYFDSWFHLWIIGFNLGEKFNANSENIIAMCSIGERPHDISDCTHFFYFISTDKEIGTQDINLVIGNYVCPVSPTPSPTLCPTCEDFTQTRPVNTFVIVEGQWADNAITIENYILFVNFLYGVFLF